MEKEQIDRINELARKKKTVGLTEAELEEQTALRKQYIAEWRANMESVLQSVIIQNEDGTQTPLQKKRPN
ncbi:MAG: DUF896 domain-containing protein [Clostridia bacterium]|nr:DUF896 domain-containing protein [Clostridia bacterium]